MDNKMRSLDRTVKGGKNGEKSQKSRTKSEVGFFLQQENLQSFKENSLIPTETKESFRRKGK